MERSGVQASEGLGRFRNKAAQPSFLDHPRSLDQTGTRAVCGTEGTGALRTWEAKAGAPACPLLLEVSGLVL